MSMFSVSSIKNRILSKHFHKDTCMGPVVQRWVINLTCCFSLSIFARLFISKLQRSKLLSIQTRSLKKYFQIYRQAVRKFALNFRLTYGELSGRKKQEFMLTDVLMYE